MASLTLSSIIILTPLIIDKSAINLILIFFNFYNMFTDFSLLLSLSLEIYLSIEFFRVAFILDFAGFISSRNKVWF
jgi:hypothetical protein